MKTSKTYALPVNKEIFNVAHSDSRAHKGKLEHAVDFPLPEGTPILASQDGKVVSVYMESQEGGSDEKFRANINKYTNRILIEHAENEQSTYAHLAYHSAKVAVGDFVKKGQVIALSGNTGLSSQSHLHFDVRRVIVQDGNRDWETMEIQWEEGFEIKRK